MPNCLTAILTWSRKRWSVAILVGSITYFVIALPTAVIENPIFGREMAVTNWSMGVIIATSVLSGLLTATYVALLMYSLRMRINNESSCSLPNLKLENN